MLPRRRIFEKWSEQNVAAAAANLAAANLALRLGQNVHLRRTRDVFFYRSVDPEK
jgi:hypothetical protein